MTCSRKEWLLHRVARVMPAPMAMLGSLMLTLPLTLPLAEVAAAAEAQHASELQVGVGLYKPPYVGLDGQDGMEVDIARAAFAAVGITMHAVQLPPARGLAMFRMRKLDALLTVDRGIGGQDYFSEPYIVYQNVAITLSQRKLEITQVEDLARYSIAAFQNAHVILGERFRAVTERHKSYKEYAQQIQQNKMLFLGRVDVSIGDRLIFEHFSRQLERGIDGSQALTVHTIFPPSPRLAVFLDQTMRDAFDEGLRRIHKDGRYDSIVHQYTHSQ